MPAKEYRDREADYQRSKLWQSVLGSRASIELIAQAHVNAEQIRLRPHSREWNKQPQPAKQLNANTF